MLNIWFGNFRDDCIVNPNSYFDRKKKPEWFNREDVKRYIKAIDKVDVIDGEYLKSPIIGGMSPDKLSSGCKCLILLAINPLCNVYASRMGDNCCEFLLEMAEKTDVIITLHHMMKFQRDFKAKVLDTGKIVDTRLDLFNEYWNIKKTL